MIFISSSWYVIIIRLVILNQISDLKLGYKKLCLITSCMFIIDSSLNNMAMSLLNPLYIFIFICLIKTDWAFIQKIFYGFCPYVISDMFMRIIGTYLRFLFGIEPINFYNVLLFNVSPCILFIPFYIYFFKGLRFDPHYLKIDIEHQKTKKLFLLLNWLFVTYSALVSLTLFIEFGIENHTFDFSLNTYFIRTNIVLIYFVLFIVTLLLLNYRIRERETLQIQQLKEKQIEDLSKYSQHVESLYREIRSFRHDYTNILVSLNESIKSGDLEKIRTVYQNVLADSDKKFYKEKYDIARLANIKNDAMKSILSSKLIESQNKGINIALEVDEPIEASEIELIDFITILSIFLDNAIEASEKSEQRTITIAYFEQDNRKILIIKNSTLEDKIDVTQLTEYGYSSKGYNRGIGLANVKKLLEKYPRVTLLTSSSNYHFNQEIIF